MGRSGGQELVSLSSEFSKHLLWVVINNYNSILISNSFFLSFFKFIFNIDFRCYFIYPVHCIDHYISQIRGICDSNCESQSTCKCTCSCETSCIGNTICLCLCNGTKSDGKECCICICKKDESNCKCICICICNNENCATEHQCKKCLCKIDLSILQTQISKIIILLYCIVCFVSRIENQTSSGSNNTCCCICCSNGCNPGSCGSNCYCKDQKINHLAIISRINWIELLFKEVGTKILELRTFKNILSFYSTIAKTCKKCCSSENSNNGSNHNPVVLVLAFIFASAMIAFGASSNGASSKKDPCKEKIDSLIQNIKGAITYYYMFGSRINDIKLLVYYKTFCPQANEIIEKLKMSVNPLLIQLSEINSQILENFTTNNRSVAQINYVIMNLMSMMVIDESIFVLSSLYKCYKTKNLIDETLKILQRCICLRIYNKNFNNLRTGLTLLGATHVNDNPHQMLYSNNKMINEGNNACLCLVVRYVLDTDLYLLIRYNEYLYRDMLSCMSRSYKKYSHSITHNLNVSKLIMLIVTSLDKIIRWMNKIYIGDKIHCFCYNVDNGYYGYLLSVILFVSSLVENLWSMDSEGVRIGIEKISNLLIIISQMDEPKVREGDRSSLSHLGFYDKQVTKHFNIVGSQLHISDSNLQLSMTITDDYNKQIYKSGSNCSLFTKPFIHSLISSISNIKISGPKFNLFYQSFTFFSHYILIKSSLSEETIHWVNEENKNLAYAYLSINAQATQCDRNLSDSTCCENVREKIVYYVICVARGKFKTLSSQITNTGIIKFIQLNNELKLYEIVNNMNKLTISIITSILVITKNILLTSDSYGTSSNTNLQSIGISNWGYEAQYENQLTTLSNHKLPPKLTRKFY